MFSLLNIFKPKPKIDEKMALQIDELEEILKQLDIFTPKQIKKLADNLRKHPPKKGRASLSMADIEKAASYDKTISADFKLKAKILKEATLVAMSRASHIFEKKRRKELGIQKARILFAPGIPLCPTMEEYKKKYDGKIMNDDKLPILPPKTCCSCGKDCSRSTTSIAVVKGIHY